MSSPAKDAASGSSAASAAHISIDIPPYSSSSAHDFFQKVYTHLKEGQLQSVKELLDNAGASTHAQLPANKGTIWEFVSKDGLTNDARAENLVKVLRKNKLFPEVKHDEFEKGRMLGNLSSAITKISAPKTAKTSSEVMQEVRLLGMRAGFTEAQVNDALEECVLPSGRKFWIVKSQFSDAFYAWQDLLISLAVKEEIILFCEGMQRDDLPESQACLNMGFVSKGFYRGLETDKSAYKMHSFHLLIAINQILALNKMDRDILVPHLDRLITLTLVAYPFGLVILGKTIEAEKNSKIAAAILDAYLPIWTKEKTPKEVADALITANPDPQTWFEFANAFMPVAFDDAPVELQKTLIAFLQAKRNFLPTRSLSIIKGPFEDFMKQYTASRDPGYARIFIDELPNLPNRTPALVFFGADRASGFMRALNARALAPISSSSADKASKADSKETKGQS